MTAADIAALQGDRARATQRLENLQRVVDVRIREFRPESTSRVGPQELVHTAARRMELHLGDFEAIYRDAQLALARSERYQPATELGRSGKRRRANEARRDLAYAAIQTGRFREAEAALRTITDEREPNGVAKSKYQVVLLAYALFRQDRVVEARGALAGVENAATRPWSIGNDLDLRFDHLFSLYAQAVLQPDDAAGAARRRELLAEAVALCDAQTDEIKAIRTYRQVRGQINEAMAAERAGARP